MASPEIDAAPSPDWVRAQELDYILSDVLEALDQVEFLVAEGRLSEYALGQADLAARVRSLIEDGNQ